MSSKDLIEEIVSDPERKAAMDLLVEAFFENLQREENIEYGGWGLDNKRPFGNSYVIGDIAEIIGFILPDYEDKDTYNDARRYLDDLYNDLGTYLKYKWRELNK